MAGARGGALDSGIMLQAGRSRVRIPTVSLEFFIDVIVPAERLREMSTRDIFWRGKGVRCVGLTALPLSCANCLEIWESPPPGSLWPSNISVYGLLYHFLYLDLYFVLTTNSRYVMCRAPDCAYVFLGFRLTL